MATGDQTLINFPRESTMKEISQALQTMAFTQAANLENISTWDQINGLSRSAYRGSANYVVYVNTSGNVSTTGAWYSNVYAPLVVV